MASPKQEPVGRNKEPSIDEIEFMLQCVKDKSVLMEEYLKKASYLNFKKEIEAKKAKITVLEAERRKKIIEEIRIKSPDSS